MIAAAVAWSAVVAVAAGVVFAYRAGRIGVVVGLLFAAASFSRVTAPIGPYSVRLEQPALVLLIVWVLLRERDSVRRVVVGHPGPVAAAGLYLGANLASAALFAFRPGDSLRIAAWLALSMAGGLVVAALVARAPQAARSLPDWIVGAAAVQVAVGLMAVLSEAILNTTWGVQANDIVLGKTYGLSWEANILAINLAMALAFLLVPASGSVLSLDWRGRSVLSVWLGFGLGLAYSRGGALGLLGAAVLVGGLLAWTARTDPWPTVRTYAGPVVRLGVVAFAAAFLTAGGLDALANLGVGWTASTVVIGAQPTPPRTTPSAVPSSPTPATASAGPSPAPGSPPATPFPSSPAVPSPTPRYVGTSDTLAIRLNNVRIGLGELPRSPLVGLGTDSFQQRHVEPSCQCPAYISNLTIGALYDSGILGLTGLVGLLAAVLYLAWRRGEWAYLVALLAMIIGYQATDAFRFASNWVVMGAVLGIAAHRARPGVGGSRGRAGPIGERADLGRSR